jgi:hypothetical protein
MSLHQIAYQLEMEQQLGKAQQDSESGRILSSEDVRGRFKGWLE